MKPKTKGQAAALLLFTAIAWGAMFPVAKDALREIDAFHLSALRYVPAALAMLAILAAVEGRQALRVDGAGLRLWLYGSFGFAGFSILGFLAIHGAPPEQAAIIAALMPLVTALVAWAMRGRRPTAPTMAAMAAAFVGVLLVITHGRLQVAGDLAWRADATMLAGVACWSVYTLGAATVPSFSSLRYTALSMAFGAATIVVATVVATAFGVAAPALAQVTALSPEIAYLSLVAGVLAVVAWNAGIGALGAPTGTLFVNLVPITAFAIAIAQGRRFGAGEAAGVLLVVAALVGNWLSVRAGAPAPRPAAIAAPLQPCTR